MATDSYERLAICLGLDRGEGCREWVYKAMIVAVSVAGGGPVSSGAAYTVCGQAIRKAHDGGAAGQLILEQHLLTRSAAT